MPQEVPGGVSASLASQTITEKAVEFDCLNMFSVGIQRHIGVDTVEDHREADKWELKRGQIWNTLSCPCVARSDITISFTNAFHDDDVIHFEVTKTTQRDFSLLPAVSTEMLLDCNVGMGIGDRVCVYRIKMTGGQNLANFSAKYVLYDISATSSKTGLRVSSCVQVALNCTPRGQ